MRWAAQALVVLLLIPATPGSAAACGRATAGLPSPLAAPLAAGEVPPRRCQGGRDTIAFGRLLVDYGLETLRYGVGIVLVFLGLVVMALGYLLALIDLLFCWR